MHYVIFERSRYSLATFLKSKSFRLIYEGCLKFAWPPKAPNYDFKIGFIFLHDREQLVSSNEVSSKSAKYSLIIIITQLLAISFQELVKL
jgi:hypothetical protein